jgi:hypothetical protein
MFIKIEIYSYLSVPSKTDAFQFHQLLTLCGYMAEDSYAVIIEVGNAYVNQENAYASNICLFCR